MCSQRVKVTLNDETAEALNRLREVSGESLSSIVSSMLDPHASEIFEVADLIEKANELKARFPLRVESVFHEAVKSARSSVDFRSGPSFAERKEQARALFRGRGGVDHG